jgi:hypothetical protein
MKDIGIGKKQFSFKTTFFVERTDLHLHDSVLFEVTPHGQLQLHW